MVLTVAVGREVTSCSCTVSQEQATSALALPGLKYKPGVIGYLDSAIRPRNPLLNKNYLNFEI